MLNLSEALFFAQQHHIVVRPTARSIALWAPGVRIPQPVRKTLLCHKQELRRLLATGDVRTCVNPGLHRPEWKHSGNQQYTCEICQRLAF